MHSSRMRTAASVAVYWGVSASGSGGVYHTPFHHPPFTTPPFYHTSLSSHPFTTPPVGTQTPVKTLPCGNYFRLREVTISPVSDIS